MAQRVCSHCGQPLLPAPRLGAVLPARKQRIFDVIEKATPHGGISLVELAHTIYPSRAGDLQTRQLLRVHISQMNHELLVAGQYWIEGNKRPYRIVRRSAGAA